MMTATTERAKGVSPEAQIQEENGARAGLYAVLSHLFAARPSASLLRHIADAQDMIDADASGLGSAWQALALAAESADPAAVAAEYDALFVSPGLPPVSPYASSYMQGRERGQLLAELRGELARLGYARAEDSFEYEDHLAALCDVMRGLIAEEALSDDAFERQQAFFRQYLAPWHERLSASVAASGDAAFYSTVSRFADAFFINEFRYFELA